METVYYDTPDLRLARWGVSLRRRAGEGWTLKLAPPPSAPGKPGVVLERDELTFQGSTTKPPEAALDVVRAYVRKAELVPVARLSTVRRRVRLVDATGTRVAEVVDDEVSVRDGRRVAARFREIEVEVPSSNGAEGADPTEGIIAPLVTRLRGAGAGAPDPTPKHIRALGPRAIAPGQRPAVGGIPLAAARRRDRRAQEEAARGPRLAALYRFARAPGGGGALAEDAARRGPAGGIRSARAGHHTLAPAALGGARAAGDADRPRAPSHPDPGQAGAIRGRGCGAGGSGRRRLRAGGRQAADHPWRAPGQRHRASLASLREGERQARVRLGRAHRAGEARGRRRARTLAEGVGRARP